MQFWDIFFKSFKVSVPGISCLTTSQFIQKVENAFYFLLEIYIFPASFDLVGEDRIRLNIHEISHLFSEYCISNKWRGHRIDNLTNTLSLWTILYEKKAYFFYLNFIHRLYLCSLLLQLAYFFAFSGNWDFSSMWKKKLIWNN